MDKSTILTVSLYRSYGVCSASHTISVWYRPTQYDSISLDGLIYRNSTIYLTYIMSDTSCYISDEYVWTQRFYHHRYSLFYYPMD